LACSMRALAKVAAFGGHRIESLTPACASCVANAGKPDRSARFSSHASAAFYRQEKHADLRPRWRARPSRFRPWNCRLPSVEPIFVLHPNAWRVCFCVRCFSLRFKRMAAPSCSGLRSVVSFMADIIVAVPYKGMSPVMGMLIMSAIADMMAASSSRHEPPVSVPLSIVPVGLRKDYIYPTSNRPRRANRGAARLDVENAVSVDSSLSLLWRMRCADFRR
jgi:hypothetical protein